MYLWAIGLAVPVVGLRWLGAPWWAVGAVLYIEFITGFWLRRFAKGTEEVCRIVDSRLAEISRTLPGSIDITVD
jgi:hypothetical protein